ncbi:sensor domain-containing protein [Kineobactrum salinum]|uniref:EAL domain-containing protein n=1 Tax=Kineobactrum salinum TaxID=2708301 RepID=A0A6C0U3F4_9GAMM|nr:EAL domain-containing protein [Kineobactrum salinum]QIB66468.1 EAL domain-containing protein [Kineobactrum salinum]
MSVNLPDLDWHSTFFHGSAPAAILDRALVIVACNRAYEEASGRSREEVLGHAFFELFPGASEEQRAPIQASCEYAWTHRRTHTVELVTKQQGESQRYWSVVNTPLLDVNGEVRYLLTQPTNITELTCFRNALNPDSLGMAMDSETEAAERPLGIQEVQQILSAQRRRLEQLFQQAPGFVCILTGPRHVYDMANDAYYQLVGHREILGYEVATVLPEVVPQGFLDKLNKVYDTGCPFMGRAIPIDLQRSPGDELETVFVDLMYQPIRDDTDRITGIFVQGHDVTETYRLSQEVAYQAAHDPLTGLANRRMLDGIGAEFERVGTHVLVYLDLDHFKIVNDRCGHHAGDELLCQVASILKKRTRQDDLLVRVGGDEFVLLLKDCTESVAQEIANQLRHAVQELIFVWNDRRYGITLSAGLAVFGSPDDTPISRALSLADSACFLAKEKGRNRIQISKPEDEDIRQQQADMDWASRIKEAIADNNVVLWGQKIVALDGSKDRLCVELLARLIDDAGQPIPPGAFIPAAERFGIVEQLDYHIVGMAFELIGSLSPTVTSPLLFVNLSGATLGSQDFVAAISRIASEYPGVSPSSICFEVTETSAITNLVRTAEAMQQLADAGFSFALDDFGSGMSSFGYLERLPVAYVKIDGEFIRNMGTHIAGEAIVEAVTKVARAMDIFSIAEYVEDMEQVPLLQSLGVNMGQGFGIHRPEPVNDLFSRE